MMMLMLFKTEESPHISIDLSGPDVQLRMDTTHARGFPSRQHFLLSEILRGRGRGEGELEGAVQTLTLS